MNEFIVLIYSCWSAKTDLEKLCHEFELKCYFFVVLIGLINSTAAALVESMVITYPGYFEILQSHLKQDFNSFLFHYIALYRASVVSFITRYYTEVA